MFITCESRSPTAGRVAPLQRARGRRPLRVVDDLVRGFGSTRWTADDIARARNALPLLSQTLYLNTGTAGLTAQPVVEKLVVKRLTFDGKAQGKLETEVSVKPGEAKRCLETTEFGEISLRSEFLHATFAGYDAVCLLIGERYLHLPPARGSSRSHHLNHDAANLV